MLYQHTVSPSGLPPLDPAKQEERKKNRRRLVQKLAVFLDEADETRVSNNDVRRLLEDFSRIIQAARMLENYPEHLPIPNPNHVIWRNHCATSVLERYSDKTQRKTMNYSLVKMVETHLDECSACRARLRAMEPATVCGQPVRPGDPNEPRRIAIDDIERVGSGPTSLNPHIGIAAGADKFAD
jgi:hypothetical protein